jgi:hypothetical protein
MWELLGHDLKSRIPGRPVGATGSRSFISMSCTPTGTSACLANQTLSECTTRFSRDRAEDDRANTSSLPRETDS